MTAAGRRTRIGLIPRLSGVGGPSSFNQKFSAGLAARGIEVTNDLDDPNLAAVLVNGGTRRLDLLWRVRRRGLRLVQRLDGMNWIHRKRSTGLRHYLRSEQNNWLLAAIRRRLARRIVYQSHFCQDWWGRVYGAVEAQSSVVHNGVDLSIYHPEGPGQRPTDCYRILCVEGHLRGGTEVGLENALRLLEALMARRGLPAELYVAGDVPASVRTALLKDSPIRDRVTWTGVVPREQIPLLDRSAHLFYSVELNAPCPNAVIEALACGLPVLGFATGALPELVPAGAGRLVPYGRDPFSLDPPDISGLAEAAADLLANLEPARAKARAHAEAALGLDQMVDGYLAALLEED